MTNSTINHPDHYQADNDPFECILLVEQYSFNWGNCMKYVWRHRRKGHPKEDLEKALWYANRAAHNNEILRPAHLDIPSFIDPDKPTTLTSDYDAATLAHIKADATLPVSENEACFWQSVAYENSSGAIENITALIKETK
ncbi:DUF3310 domain-containing protein [Bifidobacterium tissieri]|uniref:DUF3310 domain-containing protein n=1 Tax=Bifidobacterium tissieri TaxID=1630162 RepID=A0A5M9ZVH2_9BIFI|nr:DUF3310 domain-containing protein [Bifidobacterium tissieri]KAA8828671.1 DUF3310 domain-containing protein [Bifidobacterium tissieri]KAA8831614.1 DUF3310 domain-containing protein [Bifidobacterium tissieri]